MTGWCKRLNSAPRIKSILPRLLIETLHILIVILTLHILIMIETPRIIILPLLILLLRIIISWRGVGCI
jgi:hypothetical protein